MYVHNEMNVARNEPAPGRTSDQKFEMRTVGRLKDWRDFWSAYKVLETDFSETDAQDNGYR
jgi:hypothetical protein